MHIRATVTGWAVLQKTALTAERLAKYRRALTVTPFVFGAKETPVPIPAYRESDRSILFPIAWAQREFPNAEFVDGTTLGSSALTHTRLPDPDHHAAAEGQGQFVEDMLRKARESFTVLAEAPTGSGKTVAALSVAAQLGRKTLVIVPTVQLGRQWKKEIVKHLGVPEHRIGWVQQGQCTYRGMSVVIAVIHSLACRTYDPSFYSAFGTVIWDEVHIVGARSFSQSLGQFPARYKIALTATPTRKDGCAELFLNYFGTEFVVASGDAVPCSCAIVKYRRKRPLPNIGNKAVLLNIVTRDPDRNQFIVQWVHFLWEKGRNVLVLSDRIEHLQRLMSLAKQRGVPWGDMGLFTAQRIDGFTKVCKPVKRLKVGRQYTLLTKGTGVCIKHGAKVRCLRLVARGLYNVTDAERTVAEVSIENVRSLPVVVPRYTKMTQPELDATKRGAKLIFATYGMFKQGQDVPRLDAGIDATPRSDGIQAIGRIRRKVPGKLRPVWLTIHDVGVPMFENNLKHRVRDYRKAKVDVFLYRDRPINWEERV